MVGPLGTGNPGILVPWGWAPLRIHTPIGYLPTID